MCESSGFSKVEILGQWTELQMGVDAEAWSGLSEAVKMGF